MKQLLKKYSVGYIGLIGLACIIASVVAWAVQMTFGTLSVVFSIVGLVCLLVYLALDFKRVQAQLSKRSVKYGANTTVMILIVLAIVILVETISSRHDKQFDLTKNKRYTLSDQTRKILEALEKDVNVLAFFTLDQEGRAVLEDLLTRYSQITSRLTYEFVDPVKNPGRTNQYEITMNGTIVLETGEKQEQIFQATEEALTNALIKVTSEGRNVVYFLKGHGEHDLEESAETGYSIIKQALGKQNYMVKDLALLQEAVIPNDATIVIVGGPQKDLLAPELEVLNTYIRQGGNVLFMLDPDQAPETAGFLKDYGIRLGDNTIVDTNPVGRMMGANNGMPIAMSYANHPITENFGIATIFPLTRSVEIDDTLPEGISGQTLASTGPESWKETNPEELQSGEVKFDNEVDVKEPVSLAAAITVDVATETPEEAQGEGAEETIETEQPQPTQARVVVFGDSDFASNAYIGLSGNGDLFLNTISWLAKEEDLVAIRPKDPEVNPLMLNAAQANFAFLLSIVVLPLVVILTGVTVFVNRRKATR
jgi:ABC-type uncharacterized transport system involved in gliding motility auxiliary subunit